MMLLLMFKVLSFGNRPSSGGIVPTRLMSDNDIEVTSPIGREKGEGLKNEGVETRDL